ncbi:MAG: ABC transporter ATP-binding protein [Alphaproteobacteria bacterium]|nr:ABC transporter ATP-binding protein [Alphaproteobacteria bacterium]
MYFDRRLWELTRGLRGRMALGVVLGLLALAAGIARFAFLGLVLALAFRGAPFGEQLPPILGAIGSILLRAALDHARTLIAHRTATRVQAVLRARLHERVVALGPAWFAAERTGGVMLSMVDGVEQLQSFFGQYVPQLAISLCAPFAIFAFVAIWDWPVAFVLLAAALLALVGPMAVQMRERRASLARSGAFKAFGEEFLDAVQGLPTLKAFGQSGAYGRRLAARARALSDQTFWVLATSVATRGIVDLGTALGAALALLLGAWRVTHGEMSLAALLIVLMAGTEIFRPLRDLRGILHQGMLGQSAAAGIHALLDATPSLPAGGTASPAELAPTIAFENVRFAYPGTRRPAHEGLSFSLAAGEQVGVVGASGAGKSSIVRLLLREHAAQSGAIRIGGVEIGALDPNALRARIAVVAQDSTLFHGTVEENLRLGRPDASEAELHEAARAANAHEFIMALPEGYCTVIGERGARLSGGQRQRLAIARALLRDAPILVLDEALSAVDAENEAAIQQALDRLMQGRTTLILAHRLSSVIGADRILVLDRGRVAESGRHAELMRAGGLYRRLMGAQSLESAATTTVPAGATFGSRPEPDTAETGPPRQEIDTDAATVGWRQTIATLAGFIRPWRGRLALVVGLGIGRVAAFIGVGALGALIVAAIRAAHPFGGLAAALLVAAPLAALCHWLESWLAHDMAYRLLAEMRIALFATLDRLAPAYLLRRRSGDLVALATQDIETIEYFYAHTVAPAFVAVLVPLSVLGVLAAISWPLALVLLPFLAYALLAPLRGRARIDRLGAEARGALGQLGAHVTETIQGLSELLAFQAAGRRATAFMDVARRAGAARLALLADLSRQSVALEAATSLGGLAIAAVGAQLVLSGQLAAGMLPLLVLVGIAAFLPVSEIAQVSRQLADTIASTRRLHVVESEPVRIADGPLAPPAPRGGSEIRFDAVRFAYSGSTARALDGLTFHAPAGATVALVGASGAGKSTVASLLLRFWDPDDGTVTLDGTDLRRLQLDALRSRVALVAQDTYLFNDTLEANIRLAHPDAAPAALARAVEQAALADFIAALPDGLATRVGERGVQLSGGQRQRVAIARAFLKDAPVLVLDEATSHLDAISEAQVRAALDQLMRQRTTLVIAHRLSTIRDADVILVLDRGRIVERGSHAELLARRGAYARLVGQQTRPHALTGD